MSWIHNSGIDRDQLTDNDFTVPHTDYGTFMFFYPLRDIAAYIRDLLRACQALHSIGWVTESFLKELVQD